MFLGIASTAMAGDEPDLLLGYLEAMDDQRLELPRPLRDGLDDPETQVELIRQLDDKKRCRDRCDLVVELLKQANDRPTEPLVLKGGLPTEVDDEFRQLLVAWRVADDRPEEALDVFQGLAASPRVEVKAFAAVGELQAREGEPLVAWRDANADLLLESAALLHRQGQSDVLVREVHRDALAAWGRTRILRESPEGWIDEDRLEDALHSIDELAAGPDAVKRTVELFDATAERALELGLPAVASELANLDQAPATWTTSKPLEVWDQMARAVPSSTSSVDCHLCEGHAHHTLDARAVKAVDDAVVGSAVAALLPAATTSGTYRLGGTRFVWSLHPDPASSWVWIEHIRLDAELGDALDVTLRTRRAGLVPPLPGAAGVQAAVMPLSPATDDDALARHLAATLVAAVTR